MRISIISSVNDCLVQQATQLRDWAHELRPACDIEFVVGIRSPATLNDLGLSDLETFKAIKLYDGSQNENTVKNLLARQSTGEILIFLKFGTILCKGWLDEILAVYQCRAGGAIVGSIELSSETGLIGNAGVFFGSDGRPDLFKPQIESISRLRWMPVPAIAGACFSISRTSFQALGGFNPKLNEGFAQIELCLRARTRKLAVLNATRSAVLQTGLSNSNLDKSFIENENPLFSQWQTEIQFLSNWKKPDFATAPGRADESFQRRRTIQLFIPSVSGYDELSSRRKSIPVGKWTRVRIDAPTAAFRQANPIRLDPPDGSNVTAIGGLSLRDESTGALVWQAKGKPLLGCLDVMGTASRTENADFTIESSGDDPQILIRFPSYIQIDGPRMSLSIWIRIDSQNQTRSPSQPIDSVRKTRNIVVDLWNLQPGGANGGVKVLALEVVKGLASSLTETSTLSLICRENTADEIAREIPSARVFRLKEGEEFKNEQPWDPIIDVLYAPLGTSCFRRHFLPYVCVIVDLLHRDRPDLLPDEETLARETRLVENIGSSMALQCNSEYVRKSLHFHYGVEDTETFVFYNSIQHRLNHTSRKPPKSYFLYPANTWKHKNHRSLLEAYALYRSRTTRPWGLLLTGWRVGGRNEGFGEDVSLPEGALWLGYLNEFRYWEVLSEAGALFFPSLYEGFGIPILEAMKLGVPVACSNVASLPEIGGNFPLYFDPGSIESMTRAMATLSSESFTAEQKFWGRAEDEKFSWEDALGRLSSFLMGSEPPSERFISIGAQRYEHGSL